MGSFMVVEVKVGRETCFEFGNTTIVSQVDVLVLHRAPQSLHEDIIQGTAPAVHADEDLVLSQQVSEVGAGELGPLISVEYTGLLGRERRLQRLNAEGSIQGIGQPPGEHIAAVPVEDGHQIHEAHGHGYVGNVGGPDEV